MGATGVTYSYDNGVITISFPENFEGERDITLSIDGRTLNGDIAEADITFGQEGGDLPSTPLTFNILSGGTIMWKTSNSAFTRSIEYRKNNGTWTSIASSTDGAYIPVDTGDIVQFRGDNAAYTLAGKSCSFSGSTAKFDVQGNIMSLIDSDDFNSLVTLQSAYTFTRLFNNCTGLTSASGLLLPATAMTDYCYQNMFQGCSSMTTAPALPSTSLATGCYNNMFYGCSSLVTGPSILLATTLAYQCYSGMFNGCTSLTTAPELPATTLATSCYASMFANCGSLTTAPALPATTLIDFCYNQMFLNCTGITQAPELPAATLKYGCYQGMFKGCSSLNYIKCLATSISANSCTTDWVNGVAPTGTFVKNGSMTDWTIGNNGIPIGWIVEDDWRGLDKYFTMEVVSVNGNNGKVRFFLHPSVAGSHNRTIEYRKNGGQWRTLTSVSPDYGTDVSQATITVFPFDIIEFRGSNPTYYDYNGSCGFQLGGGYGTSKT